MNDSGTLFCIKHRQSGSSFTVSGHAGKYVVDRVSAFYPGMQSTAYSSDAVGSYADTWAFEVKPDVDTPDLWADHLQEIKMLAAASNDVTDNAPFNLEEQKDIASRPQGLADIIGQEFSLPGEQTKALGERIEHLIHPWRRQAASGT